MSKYNLLPSMALNKDFIRYSFSLFPGCVFYGFATTWFGISQISLLAAIAIDRYVIIVKPRGIVMTKQKAFILVICCFGHGFVWALLPGEYVCNKKDIQ